MHTLADLDQRPVLGGFSVGRFVQIACDPLPLASLVQADGHLR